MTVQDALASLGDLSPAQRQVLLTLKRRGEASADELAEALGITASGVRQHLSALRSAGLVDSRQERGKPGRPTDLYHGTELAEVVMPQASDKLMLELLSDIDDEDPALVARLFERRKQRRVDEIRARLGEGTLVERVAGLAEVLDAEGYLADHTRLDGGGARITLHNCAIWGVASHYPQACGSELEFLSEVLGDVEVERVKHKVAGNFLCGYEIRDRD